MQELVDENTSARIRRKMGTSKQSRKHNWLQGKARNSVASLDEAVASGLRGFTIGSILQCSLCTRHNPPSSPSLFMTNDLGAGVS